VQLRYEGIAEQAAPEPAQSAQLVHLDELAQRIPGFGGDCVDQAGRKEQRAMRRRHVQVRYGR